MRLFLSGPAACCCQGGRDVRASCFSNTKYWHSCAQFPGRKAAGCFSHSPWCPSAANGREKKREYLFSCIWNSFLYRTACRSGWVYRSCWPICIPCFLFLEKETQLELPVHLIWC